MLDPRAFRVPNTPPHFTGELWLNPDKSIGGIMTDIHNTPIRFIGVKDGAVYRVRGWRGEGPEFMRLSDDVGPRPDGLPDSSPHDPCPTCAGRLYWRPAIVGGQPIGSRRWCCVKCEPAPDGLWLDGAAVPAKATSAKEGTLL